MLRRFGVSSLGGRRHLCRTPSAANRAIQWRRLQLTSTARDCERRCPTEMSWLLLIARVGCHFRTQSASQLEETRRQYGYIWDVSDTNSISGNLVQFLRCTPMLRCWLWCFPGSRWFCEGGCYDRCERMVFCMVLQLTSGMNHKPSIRLTWLTIINHHWPSYSFNCHDHQSSTIINHSHNHWV